MAAPIATTVVSTGQLKETTIAPYNHKAELNQISKEIKTKLTQHFENLFTQIDKKIDNLVKQYKKQQAEQLAKDEDQEKINVQVTKQLSFLVDNMKYFLQYATPQLNPPHPLLQGDGQP